MQQDATRDDTEIVTALCSALAGRVGRDRFELWLGRSVQFRLAGQTLVLESGEAFRLEYLRRTFRLDVLAVAREVLGREVVLEFRLDPALAAPSADATPVQKPIPVETPSRQAVPSPPTGSSDAAPSREPGLGPIQRRAFASLDQFIVGSGNQVPLSAARGVVARPGQFSPLTLFGPPGCGKTHLLEGIWRLARTGGQLRRVIYLTAEQFTNQFLEALKHSGTPNFRRKYRDVELLLIDDVHFFANKQSTIVELVHTVDTLVRDGRQVVFAADRSPAELRGLGQDLIARLSSGLVCPVEPADAAARLQILEQLARCQQRPIPHEVLTFLAAELDGDARHLSGAINRLAAASEALDQPIDYAFAQAAVADLIHATRRPVRLPEIMDAVCDVFGIEAGQLQSASKSPSVTLPRMLVMFLARKYTRAALAEIGQTVGRRSHSTVVSAQHKVSAWLTAGKRVSLGRSECSLEDALRRVESQLRLG
ncbi:MAG: DnaA/Hda family protein [Pirellulaceae bacterium]